MSLESLHVLVILCIVLLFTGVAALLFWISLGGMWVERAYRQYQADEAEAGVDEEDRDALLAFRATSESHRRWARRGTAYFVVFVASIAVMLMSAVGAGVSSSVYEGRYRGAVVNTLTDSYGVTVDSRSKKDLPDGDDSVSAGLLLRLDGQAAQCTVATGYSPADLTVVCGGREIKPLH